MRTLLKDTVKEIRSSFGRFMSILLIIGLGVGFFAGIKATAPDMKNTGDAHFDKYNLMDFWIVSTMGFDDKDYEAFRKVDGIEKVTKAYSMDGILKIDDSEMVMKIMSLPKGYKNSLNKPILVDGRLPEREGEVVLEASDYYRENFKLGSQIELASGSEDDLEESLKHSSYRVVGFANSPLYITHERGTSSIGNGKVDSFLIVSEDEFKLDYYTDMYLGIDQSLNTYSEEYKSRLDEIKLDIEELGEERRKGRLDEIREELGKKLVDGKNRLEEERVKGQKDLDKAKLELDKGEKDLKAGKLALKNGKKELDKGLRSGENKLKAEEAKWTRGNEEYKKGLKDYEKEKKLSGAKLLAGEKKVGEGEKALSEINALLDDLKGKIEDAENQEGKDQLLEELKTLEAKKETLEKELALARTDLDKAEKKLKAGEEALASSKFQLDKSKEELDRGKASLEKERQNGKKRLASEEGKLKKAEGDLKAGQEEYKKGLAEFNREINKSERDLHKLEKEIRKLEKPDWYVIKRSDTRDYIELEMGADRIDSVAKVFPLFFLLIALLVCLTTMTRMVDEQRGYIGTLKALGYSDLAIRSKYLIYGILASLLGSLLGLLVGFNLFPNIIFNAYRIMFIMPPVITEFNIFYAVVSTLAAIVTTSVAVLLVLKKELREKPAMLMRPRAPVPGKRIALENIDFIWKKMKFSQKVTARNIFRYKKRLSMTIIGIAGCTALLLAGFGLRDSIMDITKNQFDVISDYEMSININNGIVNKDQDPVVKYLEDDTRVDSFILSYKKPIEIIGGKEEKDLDLIVVEDSKELNDYIRLRDRKTQKKIELADDSVVLTEKIASLLGVKIGDEIRLRSDKKEYRVKVGGITENYAFHYVYVTEKLYENLVKEKVEYNQILVKNMDTSKDFEDQLSRDLLGVEDVSSVLFITGLSKSLNDTMDSLNTVILVIIGAAGALAFIVLYNLTNINIGERYREIATIKVLGFYDGEVSSYVYRENNILTILGAFLGLGLGLILHQFIIKTVEIEMIMFGRTVRPVSLIYSFVLTLVFSALVNMTMYFRLRKIDMVESMKSVD